EPPRPRLGVTPRTVLIALALTVLLAGAATAAILITQGAPLPAPNARDLQSSGVPLPATARLAGLDAPDPQPGSPPWDIRLSRTAAGETCTAVGQVLNGQFGIVGLDHVFRALPLGGVDACGVPARGGPVLAGARVFLGVGTAEARTVVNGVTGPGAASVTVYGPDGARRLVLGQDGSFLTVYAGYAEEVRPRIVIAMRDGHTRTVALAQSLAYEVTDPSGEYAWRVNGGPATGARSFPDENCAQAGELVGRNNPSQIDSSLTPVVCGRLGKLPLFALFRRFVPGSGEHTGFPWGNGPPRTLVYGAAAPRVAKLTLTGAGAPQQLTIDPHGGVFLAVLDGHVDPRGLALRAQLRDGTRTTYRRGGRLYEEQGNRPLAEAPVPAYREPLPARVAEPPQSEFPVASTIRETIRAADPAGGPEWVLRSWRGRRNPHASFGPGYRPNTFFCFQIGVLEGGKLLEPGAKGLRRPLIAGPERGAGLGGCNDPASLLQRPPFAEAVGFVADPYAYSLQPLRTIVAGQLRPDARDAVLLGAGPPRAVHADANHAFMLVLPGRWWDAQVHISALIKGRRVGGSVQPGPPAVLAVPQARAPDPNGGAPWGFTAVADASAYGQIVGGRLAGVEEPSGQVRAGADGFTSGGNPRLERGYGPVRFDTQGGPEPESPFQPHQAPSPPQMQRRTLPGRTIITGIAEADVESVTIATPRDVRTLRPVGPSHVLIVVYDGQFFRGALTATVQLRDGRTITEHIQKGPGGAAGEPPPAPSRAARLRSDEATLRGLAQQVRRAPHQHGGGRSAGPPVPSQRTLQEGYVQLRAVVRAERARIAYERAHPGVLPAE
ncbi:MAG: hypothetical protein ACYDC2_05185, partial [Solirubrobacteraceae bacterium]